MSARITDVSGTDGQQTNIDATATVTDVTGIDGQQANIDATATVTEVTGMDGQQANIDATATVTSVNADGADVTANGSVNWDNAQPPEAQSVTATGTIDWTNLTPVVAPVAVSGTINWGDTQPPAVTPPSVDYTVNDPPAPDYPDQNPSVNYSLHAPAPPSYPNISRTITYTIKTLGQIPAVNGTAHAQGTIPTLSSRALVSGSLEEDAYHRTALAFGDWGTKKTETALVGELGPELVVDPHANRWYTVGDRGAQFANIPAGSIIFNHKQTEEIFKNGYVTSGGGRGKVAHANGTAYASGTAYADGSDDVKSKWENFVDWIERGVERLEYTIDAFTARAKLWKSYTSQNHSINSAMKETQKLIKFQDKAADKYRKMASQVGLSKDLQDKVLYGDVNLNEYDEATRQKIEDFQEMRDKAREADVAVYELRKELKELAQQKLDNIVDRFDALRGIRTSSIDLIDSKLEYWDAACSSFSQNLSHILSISSFENFSIFCSFQMIKTTFHTKLHSFGNF